MKCPRCTGLMIRDDYFDLQDEAGRCTFVAWRCLICGEVLDPVILQHRSAPPEPMVARARPQLQRFVSVRAKRLIDRSRELWDDPDDAAWLLTMKDPPGLDSHEAAELADVDV